MIEFAIFLLFLIIIAYHALPLVLIGFAIFTGPHEIPDKQTDAAKAYIEHRLETQEEQHEQRNSSQN